MRTLFPVESVPLIEVLILSRQTSYERDDRGDPGCKAEAAGLRAGGWHWRLASAQPQSTRIAQSSSGGDIREAPEPCSRAKRCGHEASRVLGVYRGSRARFAMSCRSPTRPACVAGFLGHGHVARYPRFATDEGHYPHQLP